MTRTSLFVVAVLFSFTAIGGTRDPSVPDERHVEYGKGFPYVVKVRTRRAVDGKNQYASGVLLNKRWFVTAAHVVEGTDDWGVEKGSGEVPVKSLYIHRDYRDDVIGQSDLAVGRLDGEIVLDFYPPLYEGSDEVGEVASISGYGLHGTFAGGATNSDGVRRAGSNIVERVERGMLVCTAGGRSTSLEFCIAPGDSGGGLFIGNSLAGINSLVMRDGKGARLKSGYGEESGHTRISIHREWILEVMNCDD